MTLKYDTYKDSGVQWLGMIPGHWEVEPFGRHFSFGKGLSITKADLIEEGVAVISYGQVHAKTNTGTTMAKHLVRFVSPDFLETNPNCLLKEGDFVFADTSEDLEGSGNVAFNDYPEKIFAGYHIIIARPINLDFPKYFAYYFQSQEWRNKVRSSVNGVKVFSIGKRILKDTHILLPPLSEQRAIVSYLDVKCSQLDKLVSAKEAKIALLGEMKQRIISDAVTRGLNPNVKHKATNIPWLKEVPEHWEVKRLASMFSGDVESNKDFEYKKAFKFNYGSLVPKNEIGDPEEYRDVYVKYSIVEKGDVLVNGLNLNYDFISQRVACAPSDGIITSAYVVCRPRPNVNYDYYTFLFKAMDGMKLFHGMGTGIRLTLSFKELKKQLLPLPPLSEQRAIVSYLDEKTSKLDALVEKLQAEIEHIKEYKQRLISDVVTGQIKVC